MNNDINISTSSSDSPVFGRIATFTWPDLPVATLQGVRDELGLSPVVPTCTLATALHRGLLTMESDSGYSKTFVRKVQDTVVEMVLETVVVQPGQVTEAKGHRKTIARYAVVNGQVELREFGHPWNEHLTPVLMERVRQAQETVPSGQVGNWASDVVARDFRGLQLANRGHSWHITSEWSQGFDRFMEAMVRATGMAREDLALSVFRTVDNSPETVASLAASVRCQILGAIERAEGEVDAARTENGRKGALGRLLAHKETLDRYAGLLGGQVEDLRASIEKCHASILGVSVSALYG